MKAHDVIGFEELVRPLTPDQFTSTVQGHEARHFPGDAARFERLFSFDELNALIAMWRLWSASTFKVVLDGRDLGPDEFCVAGRDREGNPAMLVDRARVQALLEQGATVVLDVMESLSPGVRALAQALQSALGAPVVCNVYCSFRAHAGFPSHYDTTDVFALHIAGVKRWRVYRGRAELPLERPGHSFSWQSKEHHDRAKGPLLAEVEMTPGDVLYLPRGQYHDALAASGASLHLSFGINRPSGLDFMTMLAQSLPDDPLFRRELPHFDDVPAVHRALQQLGARLADLLRDPQLAAQVARWQRERTLRDMPPALRLPARDADTWVRVRRGVGLGRDGAGVVVAGTLVPIDAAQGRAVDWMLARELFRASELAAACALDPGAAGALLDRLAAAGVIEAV